MKYVLILLTFFLFFNSATAQDLTVYDLDGFLEWSVEGTNSLIEASDIYIYNRGNALRILSGGVVQCSNVMMYGDGTEGVVYPDLMNSVSVTGAGSLLDVTSNLSLYSPHLPGGPGLPFDLAREIPCYLEVLNGGTVSVGKELAIANESWLYLGASGRLAIGNDYDSSMHEALVIASDGTLEIEIGGYSPGVNLAVTDDAYLDGTFNLALLNGFTPTNGASFNLFSWNGNVNGQFTSISTPALPDGLEWDASELYTKGRLNVIPEPGVASLMIIFSGGFWFFRRLRV